MYYKDETIWLVYSTTREKVNLMVFIVIKYRYHCQFEASVSTFFFTKC